MPPSELKNKNKQIFFCMRMLVLWKCHYLVLVGMMLSSSQVRAVPSARTSVSTCEAPVFRRALLLRLRGGFINGDGVHGQESNTHRHHAASGESIDTLSDITGMVSTIFFSSEGGPDSEMELPQVEFLGVVLVTTFRLK